MRSDDDEARAGTLRARAAEWEERYNDLARQSAALEAEAARLQRWAALWRLAAMVQYTRAGTLSRIARRWRMRLLRTRGVE